MCSTFKEIKVLINVNKLYLGPNLEKVIICILISYILFVFVIVHYFWKKKDNRKFNHFQGKINCGFPNFRIFQQ